MAIMQGTIMTITEVVVVAMIEEITTEEGVVAMATETVMVGMTTTRTVNSSKAMVATEGVSGMILHHIHPNHIRAVVVVADTGAVVATTVEVVVVTMVEEVE